MLIINLRTEEGEPMCAIFQLSFEDVKEIKDIADEVTRKYGSEASEGCFNADLYPKSTAPVLGPQGKVALMRWGFPMKDSSRVVFNARAESLTEKSMFKTSLACRCLVPATAFYEFDKEKRKYRFTAEGNSLIYLAALWKPYLYRGEKIYCFCIITTAPNEQIGRIHSRMPAVIPAGSATEWLEGGTNALGLLHPSAAAMNMISI